MSRSARAVSGAIGLLGGCLAWEHFLQAGNSAPDLAAGVALLRQGSTFAAVRSLRATLAGGGGRAHVPLAEAYFILNQHRFFLEEIAEAKSVNASDAEPYYIEGRYFFQIQSDYAAAARQFEQALLRDPNHVKAHCYLGISLNNMQQSSQAEAELLKAVDLLEKSKQTFYLPYQTLGSFYLKQGRSDEASTFLVKAVAMAPKVAMNHFLLGKSEWALKRGPAAIGSLQTAISLDEAFLEAHYLLARILEAQGDEEGARQRLAQFKLQRETYGAGRLP